MGSEYRKEIPTKVNLPVQVLLKSSSHGVGLENVTSAKSTPKEESNTPPVQQNLLRAETAPRFYTGDSPFHEKYVQILTAPNYISGSASKCVRG